MSGSRAVDRSRRQFLRNFAALGAAGLLASGNGRAGVASLRSGGHEPPEPRPPWPPHAFSVPADGGRIIGRNRWVAALAGDTLPDIARRFDLGYWDIVLANPGTDIWLPGKGTHVHLPRRFILPATPHEGIVINIPEMRLYYYPPAKDGTGRAVITHPVGIGRRDWSTPLGQAKVTEKIPNPAWYPPKSIRSAAAAKGEHLPRVVPPGSDNPLGKYALILNLPGYLIHGTNRPGGVGMRVSHGCIRLYPEDIAALFPRVPRGTPVYIVNQPYKMAWLNGRLYEEFQPLPGMTDYTQIGPARLFRLLSRLRRDVENEAMNTGFLLDRKQLGQGLHLATGVPQTVPLA